MRPGLPILLVGLSLGLAAAAAQSGNLNVPASIEAGAAFSIQCSGSGKAKLYIVGPGQLIKRDVQLGEAASFPAGSLGNAGHYAVFLSSPSVNETGSLEVLPADKPADLTFIAKPSRLPVALQGAITGAAYVFDRYHNLITKPESVSFELSNPSSPTQTHVVQTRNGAAWIQMDSSPHEGKDQFVARVGDVSSTRVVNQVPGDPCTLKMNAKSAGDKIQLQTDPVHDCSGNAIPDGTIVTFTESYNDTRSTVDVPLKRDVASIEMPAHRGATISVASGVVLGNQIRWEQ
ncbi:MAG: hypothetical protein WCA10_19325 [Terracidiphilus sp.]